MQDKPLLAVDVDGVISLFGFDETPSGPGYRFELIDGTPHVISVEAGPRLDRLSTTFELVWATGWQDRANDHLPTITGIGPLPVIEFDRSGPVPERFGSAHWKLAPLDAYAENRAIAWIDDSFDESCLEWARERESLGHPTLLVPTEPQIGLEEAQVEAMEMWVATIGAGYT
ncbi:MAG: hypothetical protein IPK93_06220 [Solirubrobacterales bacterium]|nr:hypothetical protein [Solirubrobacterales bacterium]